MKKIWFLTQKNYKIVALIAGLIVFTGYSDSSGSFEKVETVSNFRTAMGKKYNEALFYFLSNTWITDTIAANNIDPDFARAIVFPELVRYSWIQNEMEMAGLFSLYIQYGDSYANFSVGRFQMKPTFACQLEKDAHNFGLLRFSDKYCFGESKSVESRLERVKRLDNPLWQVHYLIAFIKVLDNLYKSYTWKSPDEKVRFYATAYNFGYKQPANKIKNLTGVKTFYTTLVPGESMYCYADIALDYYLFTSATARK